MFSRHNISRFVAAFLPVFVLIGSFTVIEIITHIDAQADADCDGRVPKAQNTPRVPRYCPDGTGDNVNYTYEYAFFFNIATGDDVVQGWHKVQYWSYEDDVYCSVNVTHNLLRNWTEGGFWSGYEWKSLSWLEDDDDDDDNDFVINISNYSMRYNGVDTDGDNSIDIICPYHRHAYEFYQRCDFEGDDEQWARHNWHGWEKDIDYLELVVTADELTAEVKAKIKAKIKKRLGDEATEAEVKAELEAELQKPNKRWGKESGEGFYCYDYGSGF